MKKYLAFFSYRFYHVIIISLLLITRLTAQPQVTKDLPQYLLSEFSPSEILMKAGNYIGLDLNYNTITQKMVFKQKGQLYNMVNPQEVDTVFIEERQFVTYDSVFLEVLTKGKVSFFIQHKSTVTLRTKPTMTGTAQTSTSNFYDADKSEVVYFNQKLPDKFVVKPANIYCVRVNDKMAEFLNERQLLKALPDYSDQIKSFIKASNLKISNRADLIKIAEYCKVMME
jgi:hypothetical protein